MRYLFIVVFVFFLMGCSSNKLQPEDIKKLQSYMIYQHPSSSLYYLALDDVKSHYPKTGFYPLEHNYDAFIARIALIERAKKSLELQYFIFENDETSIVIVQKLLEAADRGVRVRILIDDLLKKDDDNLIASLAVHKNIEIKLFNPTKFRKFLGWIQLAFNVDTLGRRMHNKLLIADNSAVILGGRNIENIYYGADNKRIFIDNDILAIGPLAIEAVNSFEMYWHSNISKNIKDIYNGDDLYDLNKIKKEVNNLIKIYEKHDFAKDLENRKLTSYIRNENIPLIYGKAKLYYDIPTKITMSEENTHTHLSEHLLPIVNNAKKSLIVINPYFMPNKKMIKNIQKLLDRGVKVTVLTNSLATNDAIGVYAAYSTYHKKLLKMGVELYELSPYSFDYIYKNQKYRKNKIPRSSLHAKTMIIDDDIFIIGSANLDPRSIKLNTEVVAVIYSKELVSYEKKIFYETIKLENVYKLSLSKRADVYCFGTCIPQDDTQIVWTTKKG